MQVTVFMIIFMNKRREIFIGKEQKTRPWPGFLYLLGSGEPSLTIESCDISTAGLASDVCLELSPKISNPLFSGLLLRC